MNANFENLDHLSMEELELRFTRDAIDRARQVHDVHSLPHRQRWINLIVHCKSAVAAWRGMSDSGYSVGLADLSTNELYYLTVEYQMLMPQYKRLFEYDERKRAAELLIDFGWKPEALDDDGCLTKG